MKEKRSRLESGWTFVVLALAVVAIGCALWVWIVNAYPVLNDRAAFGNLFGGINTLFAALAFAALTYTLILQQRALALQRSQIQEQQEQLTEQNARMERQAFEAMLVRLLGFHHEITRDVYFQSGQVRREGRHAIRSLADEMNGIASNLSRDSSESPSIAIAQKAYEQLRSRSRGVLDHYFRNLYHIVKFIDASGMRVPRRYTSLVRAQLSPAELLLLFYNGLTDHGEKFRPLMVKYAMLEQLTDDELAVPAHKSLYDHRVYGEGNTPAT